MSRHQGSYQLREIELNGAADYAKITTSLRCCRGGKLNAYRVTAQARM
ncbi:hypothetical protein [Actinoplanes sp. NPDC026623]